MIIKVENTDVFFNDKMVNYDRADINTLRSTLEERLLSLPDETQIKVDFNYGDNDICTIIEELLADLGLSYSLVPD